MTSTYPNPHLLLYHKSPPETTQQLTNQSGKLFFHQTMTLTSLIPTLTPPNAQADSKPTPNYTPESVPRIKNAKRLSTTRRKQLIRAAAREYDDPPPPPGLGECCGSSCDPCVNDLWREELACWRERWGDTVVDRKGDDAVEEETTTKEEGHKDQECRQRMPGSFDW
ncbi:hypothetical protein IFM58399_00393 [Aspergillus lentulus]|uniref:Oxidoreductase-like domain-containing protein n=1 Tax=Aspergillus lentulus TaxID=293939 RepID=A0ABQ1AZB1_ASPLE|nr:uncharacterized protein IFM58399_00393 [Aspergillus lentulus]KAF4164304.1 hypothetical protein CNMCM6936_009373 [Aspergillus lentulus]GFF23680.1 hypothetical protein IFM58399_00393 [Aspergillus lentulus]GFF86993.1 hypothetical protein IFM47457_07347 [Aspergillus lentulus]GFF90847.1 hypothetical protein IFM60648_09208 [Aspergillus lentulus]GFF98622.1 hypothetical protein IFM61392_00392 [Aspergillus lentulus]